MRTKKKLPVGRAAKTRIMRVKIKKAPVLLIASSENPLITMARVEKLDRRRQFLIALASSLSILTGDDMNRIEPILFSRIGANAVDNALKVLSDSIGGTDAV